MWRRKSWMVANGHIDLSSTVGFIAAHIPVLLNSVQERPQTSNHLDVSHSSIDSADFVVCLEGT